MNLSLLPQAPYLAAAGALYGALLTASRRHPKVQRTLAVFGAAFMLTLAMLRVEHDPALLALVVARNAAYQGIVLLYNFLNQFILAMHGAERPLTLRLQYAAPVAIAVASVAPLMTLMALELAYVLCKQFSLKRLRCSPCGGLLLNFALVYSVFVVAFVVYFTETSLLALGLYYAKCDQMLTMGRPVLASTMQRLVGLVANMWGNYLVDTAIADARENLNAERIASVGGMFMGYFRDTIQILLFGVLVFLPCIVVMMTVLFERAEADDEKTP